MARSQLTHARARASLAWPQKCDISSPRMFSARRREARNIKVQGTTQHGRGNF